MTAASIRRSAVAASAVCLALTVAACGAHVLTAPELEEAVLAKGDVEGRVLEQTTPDVATADQVRVDKAVCEPLAHAVSGAELGSPAAIVSRTVILETAEQPAEGSGLTSMRITLAAYEGDGAQKAVAVLRGAARACAGGFIMESKSGQSKILKVEEAKVPGHQDAAGWVLTYDLQAIGTSQGRLAVVIKDGTLARFVDSDVTSAVNGGDFPPPTAVIDAQVAKLG